MRLWLTTATGMNVERDEIPRPGGAPYKDAPMNGIGVLHDTENDTLDAAVSFFKGAGYAPHFVVGDGRIVQVRPIGAQASTLHDGGAHPTNSAAFVQIEAVGRAQTKLWEFPAHTHDPLTRLLAELESHESVAIPLIRPDKRWEDDGSDLKPQANGVTWATNNTRRQQAVDDALWPNRKGWWMHLEVPYQDPTWHWDCGALAITDLLDEAGRLADSGSGTPGPGGGGDKELTADESNAVKYVRSVFENAGVKLQKAGIIPSFTKGEDGNAGKVADALVALLLDAAGKGTP